MKNKMELKELKKEVKVISADTGLAEGTIVRYEPEIDMYVSNEEHTEVGEGYEYTTTAVTKFSPGFVVDNMGILFVSEETEVEEPKEELSIKEKLVEKDVHFYNKIVDAINEHSKRIETILNEVERKFFNM